MKKQYLQNLKLYLRLSAWLFVFLLVEFIEDVAAAPAEPTAIATPTPLMMFAVFFHNFFSSIHNSALFCAILLFAKNEIFKS